MTHAPEPRAAPPDAGGHLGSKTKGPDTLDTGAVDKTRGPPLHQDASGENPRRQAPAAWLILGGLVALSLLAVWFKWLMGGN